MNHEQLFLMMAGIGLLVGIVVAVHRKALIRHIVIAVALQVITFYTIAILDALTQGNFFIFNAFLAVPFALYFGWHLCNFLQTYLFIYAVFYIFPALLIFTGKFYI
jgi:hypothetical protein